MADDDFHGKGYVPFMPKNETADQRPKMTRESKIDTSDSQGSAQKEPNPNPLYLTDYLMLSVRTRF